MSKPSTENWSITSTATEYAWNKRESATRPFAQRSARTITASLKLRYQALWLRTIAAMPLDRITVDPEQMGGLPCIRGMRVTVSMVLGQLAAGVTIDELL